LGAVIFGESLGVMDTPLIDKITTPLLDEVIQQEREVRVRSNQMGTRR